MRNPIEGKPEKFAKHQGLGILALEDVNTSGANLSEVMPKQKMLVGCSKSGFDSQNELTLKRYPSAQKKTINPNHENGDIIQLRYDSIDKKCLSPTLRVHLKHRSQTKPSRPLELGL